MPVAIPNLKETATNVGTCLQDGPRRCFQWTVEDAGPYKYAMTWFTPP